MKKLSLQLFIRYYRPQRSCGQGNIFAPVCQSVHRGASASVHAGIPLPRVHPPGSRHPHPPEQTPPRSRHPPEQTPPGADPPEQTSPWDQTPPWKQTLPRADTPLWSRQLPPKSRLRHTVNERPVHILLECILVCHQL